MNFIAYKKMTFLAGILTQNILDDRWEHYRYTIEVNRKNNCYSTLNYRIILLDIGHTNHNWIWDISFFIISWLKRQWTIDIGQFFTVLYSDFIRSQLFVVIVIMPFSPPTTVQHNKVICCILYVTVLLPILMARWTESHYCRRFWKPRK